MMPVKQIFRHKPPVAWGDCHRSAIACVLNMRPQDVPHFFDKGASSKDGFEHVRVWLQRRGLVEITVAFNGSDSLENVLAAIKVNNPGLVYLLGGTSRTCVNHTVVCCDDKIVCDPSLTDAGIIGPMDDGNWWLTFFGSLVATHRERAS